MLLVTPRWTRDGGVATHVVSSAVALAAHGLDVHVLAARLEMEEPIAGVTLHRSGDLFNAQATPEAKIGEAGSLSPSVIHLHQFEDPDVVALLQRNSPVVISVHGYSLCTSGVYYFRPGHECTRAHGRGCAPNLLLRGCWHKPNPLALPDAYRRATRSLGVLRRANLAISYSSAVDRHLARNGIAARTIVPLFTTVMPASAGGHAERRRVVFAGRVVPPKGVGVLLRAAREVPAEFVVCGDGRELPAMRALAKRLGVDERVHFTGWLSAQELALELAEASVVAVPSLWPEPAGLAGIEALAAGRPVVASATGGVGDWLHDGVTGLAVKPGDPRALARALRELLDDPERQRRMGEAGRRMVSERFTSQRHVAALLQAYEAAHASWSASRADRPLGAAV